MSILREVVIAVGNKFNGSVLLNEKWYSFKKGTLYDTVVVGKTYEFVLEPWKYKGKSGQNITSFNEIVNAPAPPKVASTPARKPTNNSRDFDKEARGKTRCQMFSAALQSPILQQYFYTKELTLEQILETVKEVADNGTGYTFGE